MIPAGERGWLSWRGWKCQDRQTRNQGRRAALRSTAGIVSAKTSAKHGPGTWKQDHSHGSPACFQGDCHFPHGSRAFAGASSRSLQGDEEIGMRCAHARIDLQILLVLPRSLWTIDSTDGKTGAYVVVTDEKQDDKAPTPIATRLASPLLPGSVVYSHP